MCGLPYVPRCFAVLCLLALIGVASNASAGSFIALDFGNPAGPTPPSQVFSIDYQTGAATSIGFAGVNRLNALAMNAGGEIITKRQDIGLLKVDPTTGATSFWAASPPNTFDNAMAFDSSGDLFLTGLNSLGGQSGSNGLGLWRYNPSTSQTTFVGDTRFNIVGLEFAPDGTLYGWDLFEGLVRIDTLTGRGIDVNPLISNRNGTMLDHVAQTLAFGPDGKLYGAWESLYQIDLTTGAYTNIGGSYADIRGMVWYVPEPGTLSLLGVGLFAIALRRRSAQRAAIRNR
jgi:hypothetical protein